MRFRVTAEVTLRHTVAVIAESCCEYRAKELARQRLIEHPLDFCHDANMDDWDVSFVEAEFVSPEEAPEVDVL
jgi:hypothetical protein